MARFGGKGWRMVDEAGWASSRVSDAVLTFLVLAPLAALIALLFVRWEDPVYVWDFRHYWAEFQHYGELIAGGSPWWAEAQSSIRTADYNPVAAILLAPVYAAAGGSRGVYVGAVAALYLVPAALFAAILATRTRRGGRRAFVFVALLAVLFVPFWRPTLRGMVDIIALVPLASATLLILFRGRLPAVGGLVVRALAIGVFLWLAFLLRRHLAYTVVALFLLYAVVEAIRALSERNRKFPALTRLLVSVISVVVFLALALFFQWDLVLRAATTDYSFIYQAYQQPFTTQIDNAVSRLGLAFLLLAGIGTLLAIRERNSAALASLGVAIVTFLLFSRTQAMADHHFLPVAFFLFPVITFPVIALVERNSAPTLSFAVILSLFGALSFATATVAPNFSPNLPTILTRLLPKPLPPLRLERIASYRDLTRQLQELVGPDQRIVMFASSTVVSDELFRILQPSLSPLILQTPHIGEVGLFDFEQMSADFAVVFDPLPTHMAPGTQEHLVLANDRLLSGTGFGAAFEPISGTFELDRGVRATILERTRPVTRGEIDEFYDALLHAFPHWRDLPKLTNSRFAAKRVVTLGDVYGLFRSSGTDSFVAHPGVALPTVVRFDNENETGAPDAMRITVSRGDESCDAANGIGVTLGNDADLGERHVLVPGETAVIAFPEPRRNLTIKIDNNSDPTCDTAYFHFASSL